MKVNYTIDLDEYETLFEIRRLHCGPSLCIKNVHDGCLINLLVLSNIAFTESSFQIFLEEIEKISKLPPHPCIIRYIGLAKPNPNFYNSIGIAYEFCPKCFSLECIIGDILSDSKENKVDNFNSTFGHNGIIKQENQIQNHKVDDDNKELNNSNSNKAIENENNQQNTKNQSDDDKIDQNVNDLPSLSSKNDSNDNITISTSEDNLNISVSHDSNFNNNDSFISNDNDLRFDDNIKDSNDYDSNFDNSNANDNDSSFNKHSIVNDKDLEFDNSNANDNDSSFNKHSIVNDNDLEFDNNNNNNNELNFDDDNNNDNYNEPSFGNNTEPSFEDNKNNDTITDFDENNNEKLLDNDNKADSAKNSNFNDDVKDQKINNNDNQKTDNSSKEIAQENSNSQKSTSAGKKNSTEDESLLNHEQTLILLYGISNALSFLHQHGIAFMNLTISNILLDENLEPKIQYYGITSLFEYFTMCCCNPIGNNFFYNQSSQLTIVNSYIINYNHIIRNIGNNDFFDFDGFRIVRNKSISNIQNSNFLYIIRNLTNEYIDGEDQSSQDEKDNQKSKSFLDRNLKDLIFVSPEVLKGQVPDKMNDVYAFSYLLFVFVVQERLKWILKFDISFINNILKQNRLALKSNIPILIKNMISRSWDSIPKCRPDISEINWLIGELGQYFFSNHEYGSLSQRIKRYEKFNQFKLKLPTIKRDKNLFSIDKNTKMLYNTVKQLPISTNGQNYAQSVIILQSLLMNLRNSTLFDTLDIIVLNKITKSQNTSPTSQFKQKKQKNKKIEQAFSALNLEESDLDNDNYTDSTKKNTSAEFYQFESLTDSDYEIKFFNQLYFLQTKEGVYSLALNITVACTSRFKKILHYARLVSELYHGYRSKYPYLANLKKYLLSFFLTSLANYCAYPNALPIVALIFYCLQLHVYETNEMINTINDFYEKYKNEKKISISILFCWFCPEIEAGSPDLYNKMFDLVKTQCQYDYFPYAFKKFIKHINKYKENNWSFYYNLRFDKDLNSYTYLLRKDDISSFQKMCLENRRLINAKIDPDIFIPCIYAHHYPTTVMYTALFSSIRCCIFLLKNGARTASWDRKYRLLPSYSIAGGDENVFIHCLQSNKEDDSLMQTAAQFHRNYFFYRSFLMDKKMLTSMDKFGKSVMSAAAGSNNVSALIFSFVQKSCRDNFVESFGRTPLHVAAEQEMIDVLRVLLFLANDTMNANNNSNSSLIADNEIDLNGKFDANFSKKSKITSKIKNKIASKLGSNKASQTTNIQPIDQPNENDKKVTDSLTKVEQIVDVNARDSWGMTPLHLAADKMKRKSVKILFTSPYIDVNIKNNSGKTAVYYAVKTGDLKLVKLFLKNPKVDFCCQTKKGETPLHTAVKMERPDIVKLIIENKPSSVYIPNSQNMSPFEMAVASNTTEIADIFHSYIMKKYEEKSPKQIEIVSTNDNLPQKEEEDKIESIIGQEKNDQDKDSEAEKKDDNDNDDNDDDEQIVTTEIPFIKIEDGDDEDEDDKNKRRRRKKKKGNDSDECVVF